jgi:UDP-GlcNAc:undecaprenyl-phosphate/decaprenyl-phosphate GlcNAc-1-phosphate transferase
VRARGAPRFVHTPATHPALTLLSLYPFQHPIGLYIAGFGTALAGSLVATYAVRERARRSQLFDGCEERKVHRGEIPRLGGVGVFVASALGLSAAFALYGADVLGSWRTGLPIILGGAAAVHFLGLFDDLYDIRARYKLLAQVVIALCVYFAGVRVTTISLPFFGITPLSPGVGLLFTVLWLVGITNAFNLIDGLDGLASGAAMFALTTMFVVASINGQDGAALVTIILAGATLGFLVYNFPPASIFLGDSGSLFLGFMLAGVGLLSSQKSQTVVAVAIPVVSLGLPVLDTGISILRRFLRGQPIFSPDRGHIHHRLLMLGHSPRRAALLLYGACALLALGGMLLVNDSGYVALVLVVIGLGACIAIQRLRYHEFQEFARLVRKGVRQREIIARGVHMREVSARVSGMGDLVNVFDTLAGAFASDDFQRTELRLRPSFIYRDDVRALDRRLEDDVPVWTWSRSGLAEPSLWEIKLPLMARDGSRIGSLVLWQDGLSNEIALSHLHTIAGELRNAVQEKVFALWHTTEQHKTLTTIETYAPETTFERVVPLPRADESFRRADDEPLGEEIVVSPKRERRTNAGARPRAL